MSPAVIEIFVAELTAPVGLTEALPGLITGAMDAPRVRDTFVTVQALPAILAPGDRQHTPLLASRTFRKVFAMKGQGCKVQDFSVLFHFW